VAADEASPKSAADAPDESRKGPRRATMTVRQLRMKLLEYPDDAHVGVHVMDSHKGHRFISAHRTDMTVPFDDVPVCVVWISAVRDEG
jgi:hypothetical protein